MKRKSEALLEQIINWRQWRQNNDRFLQFKTRLNKTLNPKMIISSYSGATEN